jgi:hypothetical protein
LHRARITVQSRWLCTIGSVNRDLAGAKQSRGRIVRILAALLAAFWGLAFYGLIDLLAFAQGREFHAALLLSTGWGLLFLFLVAAPLATLCVRPSAVSSAALARFSFAVGEKRLADAWDIDAAGNVGRARRSVTLVR